MCGNYMLGLRNKGKNVTVEFSGRKIQMVGHNDHIWNKDKKK